jgi:hypothetical protein
MLQVEESGQLQGQIRSEQYSAMSEWYSAKTLQKEHTIAGVKRSGEYSLLS